MAKFNYITRGMSAPHKKQKVYFCCHPEDVSSYIERISGEILELHNCAVWYDAEPETEYEKEELEDYLLQMQMFVIPVTRKFLETDNRAKNVEFAYAVEHHIPVLPLMQEDNLVELFNEKCGQIQYLNPFERDHSAIQYKEKFSKFLSSVLVGEELADKIREAFDGYIFLSYRKKDRSYANRMMKKIHSYEICRDVAIWYDEYLIPGENFQEGIEDSLKKAHIFALVVTPNLIKEENYVMSVEYPMAQKEGKNILPIMWKDTDEYELYVKYDDIPDVISYRDGKKIEKKLNLFLKERVNKEKKEDPRQLYYIGLAYLGGIDMEINYERAQELILRAALKDYYPAMEKLAEMYRLGNGVDRDYEKAAYWQEKLVEAQERELKTGKTMTGDDVFDIIKNLLLLAEDQAVIWQSEKKKSHYEKICFYTKNLKDAPGAETFRLTYILGCQSLGIIYEEEKDYEQSEQYFLEGLAEGEEMWKKGGDDILLHHVMNSVEASYRYLGSLYKEMGDEEREREYFQKSFQMLQQFSDVFSGPEAAQRLCRNYMHQEEECRKKNDLEGAKSCCLKSIGLLENALKEEKKSGICVDLILTYIRYAGILEQEESYAEADEAYEKAFFYAKKNESDTATFDAFLKVMDVCRTIASARKERNDQFGARVYGLLAADKAKKIYDALQKTEYKDMFLKLCGFVLGTFDERLERENQPTLERYLQELTWTMMVRYEDEKTERNREQLASLYCVNGWILELNGKKNQKYLEDACGLWEKCAEASQGDAEASWEYWKEPDSGDGPYDRLVNMLKEETHIDWEMYEHRKIWKRMYRMETDENIQQEKYEDSALNRQTEEDTLGKEEATHKNLFRFDSLFSQDEEYDDWFVYGGMGEMDDKTFQERLKKEKEEKRNAQKQLKEAKKKKIKKQIEKKGLAAYMKGLFS